MCVLMLLAGQATPAVLTRVFILLCVSAYYYICGLMLVYYVIVREASHTCIRARMTLPKP